MNTREFMELLDEIRKNLMAYVWAIPEQDEVDASYNLQTIFECINQTCKAYEKLWSENSQLRDKEMDLTCENVTLKRKIRELEERLKENESVF